MRSGRCFAIAASVAIADAATRSGCRSVAFTYNDPVIFLEYAIDVAQACRERGLKTVAVSAGYIAPEPRIEFFRYMDAANIDLKGFLQLLEISNADPAQLAGYGPWRRPPSDAIGATCASGVFVRGARCKRVKAGSRLCRRNWCSGRRHVC
jgi:hypothetical protein